MNKSIVKTRFAPSPTGYLHVGGLRTALFNFLLAKKNNGVFVLRIEDTDQKRKVEGSDKNLIEMLKKFNLDFDEDPTYQSERLPIYQKYAEELVEKGHAWKPKGENTIRQKIPPAGSTEYMDEVYGKISIENRKLDEGVLIKSDGFPTYNFANVVDDHEMGITHVMRGEEFITSTPKHVLLYQAFGWDIPKFIHLPLILDKSKKKLSKRTGDVAVENYLEKGYLPEAILNFIALLGWNPKTTDEIFSLEELIQNFDISKINKSGAVFDIEKLEYINRQWQKQIGDSENDPLYQSCKNTLSSNQNNFDEKLFSQIWKQILERISGPSDLNEKLPEFNFYFEEPKYDSDLLQWKDNSREITAKNLQTMLDFISKSDLENMDAKKFETETKNFLNENEIGIGDALWPLRVALSGQKNSPGPFEIILAFQKAGKFDVVVKRIETAIQALK